MQSSENAMTPPHPTRTHFFPYWQKKAKNTNQPLGLYKKTESFYYVSFTLYFNYPSSVEGDLVPANVDADRVPAGGHDLHRLVPPPRPGELVVVPGGGQIIWSTKNFLVD